MTFQKKLGQKNPKIRITTNIPIKIWEYCQQLNINYNDLLVFAVAFKQADYEGVNYPPCNLLNKIESLSKLLSKLSEEKLVLEQENYELKERLKGEKAI